MILGRDLLNELGIVLNFNDKTITWEKAQITMRTYPSNNTTKTIAETWFLDAAEETTMRMNDDRIYPRLTNPPRPTTSSSKKTMQLRTDTNRNKSTSHYTIR